jgi:hypothetical protein
MNRFTPLLFVAALVAAVVIIAGCPRDVGPGAYA